jgi:hypothetical protein
MVGGRLQRLVGEKVAVADCFVNAGQILVDNAPRPQVQMADFGVAHLVGRQPHFFARGV